MRHLTLACALVLAVSGCGSGGGGESPAPAEDAEVGPSVEPVQPPTKINRYLALNGSQFAVSQLSDPEALDVGASSFTIEMQLYVKEAPAPKGYALLAGKSYGTFETRGYEFLLDGSMRLTFIRKLAGLDSNGVAFTATFSTTYSEHPLSLGKWHHVAVGCGNEQDVWMFAVDGKVSVTPVTYMSQPAKVESIVNSPSPFHVGGVSNPEKSWGLAGSVDDVRVSKVLRYSTDYVPPSRGGLKSDSDTLALWTFGESGGTSTFLDGSKNGVNLAGMNGASTGPTFVGYIVTPTLIAK